MPDGQHYGVMLQSMAQGAAEIRLTLYSEGATYAVTLPSVVFDRRLADLSDGSVRSHPFAAAPAFFKLPQPDKLDAARSEIAATATPACSLRYWYSLSLEQRLNPKYVESATTVSEDQVLAQLFGRLPSADATLMPPDKTPECEEPYARARVAQLARPFYPGTLVNFASGTALVGVDLSAAGAVENVALVRSTGNHFLDLAALKSAASTIYRPEYFRCQPIAARYLFSIRLSP
jgi:TonB family protein